MKTEWNLDILYKGLDDPAYEADIKALEVAGNELAELVKKAEDMPLKERAEAILLQQEKISKFLMKLYNYIGFSMAVDTENGDYLAQESKIMTIYNKFIAADLAADRILAQIEDVDALARESSIVAEYVHRIKTIKRDASHKLSDEVEAMVSAMDMTGGGAWGNLQSFLTSTVKVDYEGKEITLTEARNLAYSEDAAVRKAAYEAELAAYEKIQDSIAYSINNIKKQFTMLTREKGYESPLARTLEASQMSRETLDALMAAVEEYLPVFRKYLRHKAEKLGYSNGLPWFELFAPMGKSDKKYSIEECRDYLVNCYKDFCPELSDMISEAFDNEWIDFYPRNGKQGGAFCGGLGADYKQSRILTNYDGSFSSVDTLAHELGHAFHNRQLENERELNNDYPMPVAETASTFNEVFLGAYALKQATNDEEKLALLESALLENCQCVVDIYSRYIFETAVFDQCEDKFLMAEDLKKLMLEAQTKAYGDGLDPEYMHPYMWACKSHYYSSSLSFYNFPYTFGNLFAEGLYALYLKEGDSFVGKYKEMLRNTPKSTIEEDGQFMGIDLTDKKFWEDSLKLIASQIDEYCKL